MQQAYMQPQTYIYSHPLAHNSQVSRGVSPPNVSNSTTPGFAQQVTPYYNAQPYTGIYGDPAPAPPGLGRGSDMYGGDSILGHGLNYTMAGSWGPLDPSHSGYTMPNFQYDNLGHGDANYTTAGYGFAADQFRGPTVNSPFPLQEAYAVPNNQGGPPVWRFFNCWVSYAEQDELHVTIALRRIPSA